MPGEDESNEIKFEYSFYYTVAGPTGVETLTGYALEVDPLFFKPVFGDQWPSEYSDKRIVWDFGDGTKVESITGRHSYSKPGKYRVRSYIYDNRGNAYYNTFSVTVEISDFIQDKILLDVDRNTCDIDHLTGEIKNPIAVAQYNSARVFNKNNSAPPVITYIEPKSFSANYDYFNNERFNQSYGHLIPSYTFIQRFNSTENLPVSAVQIEDYDNIYAVASAGKLLTTTQEVEGAEFAGISSRNTIYFRSDIPGVYNLSFGFEQGAIFDYTNTTTYGISAKICENATYESLSITSNGLDGEDLNFNAFDINPVKFACTKIPFVVKIKDDDDFTQKALPLIELESLPGSDHLPLTATLTDGVSTYDAEFVSNFNDISSSFIPGNFNGYAGGFFKGYFVIDTDVVLEDVWIQANTTYDGNALSGISNKFSIYPKDYYIVAKQGEDIDFTEVFKDVAIQPLFTDTRVLMNDFIGSIFGNIESAQDSIGKSTYEKIQNFVDNNSDLDHANIDQLASIIESYNLPKVNKYSTPPKIKRLLDLLSISKARLFGDVNQNRDDFNSFGYQDNSNYGIDRCDPIPQDGVIFAGFDIVAFEKYSGRWTTLNTMLPLCASSSPPLSVFKVDPLLNVSTCLPNISCTEIYTESLTAIKLDNNYLSLCIEGSLTDDGIIFLNTNYYNLSDYNESWGWPLTLDGDGSLFDVYEFYYKTRYDKTEKEGSVINFEDENTTIKGDYTYSEWSKPNGIMSNIFANALYDGLDLFNCTTPD